MSGCGNASSGALTELAAVGALNAYTSINPEKTFFAQLYRRHTNFAIAESDLQLTNAPIGSAWGAFTARSTIQRMGDLLEWLFLKVKLEKLGLDTSGSPTDADSPGLLLDPVNTRIFWTNAVGHAMINEVCLEIGGQVVDTWTGEFLQVWERYTGKPGKYLQEMIGQFDSEEDLRDFAAQDRTLYIPLPFYFCRERSLHLPLIALQYHEVALKVCVRARSDLICRFSGGQSEGTVDHDTDPLTEEIFVRDAPIDLSLVTGGKLLDAAITSRYVYLDTMERRIMAQQPHEFLITQVQRHEESCPANTASKQVTLHFNHPVRQMWWLYQEDRQLDSTQCRYFNYGVELVDSLPHLDPSAVQPLIDPIASVSLCLNGHDRIASRDSLYFRTAIPWIHSTNIPDRFIYSYSFALHPENGDYPSGDLNLSRIDNVVMKFTMAKPDSASTGLPNAGKLRVYAMNHQVSKIAGGMHALRFAN